MPVLVPSTDKNNILIHSSFSLANLERDAGERLRALVDFIQSSQMASTYGQYIGCSHAVAEQIAYLAYWKDYPLEFRIGRYGRSIVVMAHFPKQPEFDCILAVFHDRHELHAGVQKWFECFCRPGTRPCSDLANPSARRQTHLPQTGRAALPWA